MVVPYGIGVFSSSKVKVFLFSCIFLISCYTDQEYWEIGQQRYVDPLDRLGYTNVTLTNITGHCGVMAETSQGFSAQVNNVIVTGTWCCGETFDGGCALHLDTR